MRSPVHQRTRSRQYPEGWLPLVVPRMFGGLCTPDELRAIANVADKFKVPEIKVTGGQRIDMFGVKRGPPSHVEGS